jgi:hypothetical protein
MAFASRFQKADMLPVAVTSTSFLRFDFAVIFSTVRFTGGGALATPFSGSGG